MTPVGNGNLHQPRLTVKPIVTRRYRAQYVPGIRVWTVLDPHGNMVRSNGKIWTSLHKQDAQHFAKSLNQKEPK